MILVKHAFQLFFPYHGENLFSIGGIFGLAAGKQLIDLCLLAFGLLYAVFISGEAARHIDK